MSVLRTDRLSIRQRAKQHRETSAVQARRKYGVVTAGAYEAITAWWSREHWLSEVFSDLSSPDTEGLRQLVKQRGPVSKRAIFAVATAMANCADSDTGRNALPGNVALTAKPQDLAGRGLSRVELATRLMASTGYGLTTVQKALRVLEARGFLVQVRTGKNWLSRADRLELWEAGSKARERRNVWACSLPRGIVKPSPIDGVPVDKAISPAAVVDNSRPAELENIVGCDLPLARRAKGSSAVPADNFLTAQTASRSDASRRTPTNETVGNRAKRADKRTVRVAVDLKARIPWLAGIPASRIMPSLDRFARAGWSAREVHESLDGLIVSLGWRVLDPKVPWAYLAMLLRRLEPTDRILAAEHEAAMRLRDERYQELLRTGPGCPHGMPGGALPSPQHGRPGCPLCRAS